MKIKLAGITLALAVAATSQANYKFHFAYGDASLASLNNSSVGTVITPGSNLRIPTAGNNFSVQIWAERLTSTGQDYQPGGTVMVAYDMAPVANSTTSWDSYSSFAHRRIAAAGATASASINNAGTFTDVYDNSFTPQGPGSLGFLSRKFRGAHTGNSSSPRMFGLSAQFKFEAASGNPICYIAPTVGQRFRLFDMQFISNLLDGQSYGFAQGEVGLNLFAFGPVTGEINGGSSSWMGKAPTGTEIGSRLNLLAVPEPSSALAVAVGALALLRRNRRASKEVRS
ncbi:MAG: PEP-CTERM sorting domain-containing protein [Chthonomonas sp.]|nr:PEP-CTERM sorting domain-containing protein [Chthonomonas sp.]